MGGRMKVCKIFEWDAAHHLTLPYDSPRQSVHGHHYLIELEIEGSIDENGLVVDFKMLKENINDDVSFDHKDINVLYGFDDMNQNPTAENIVIWLKPHIDHCLKSRFIGKKLKVSRIRVWETPTSFAEEEW